MNHRDIDGLRKSLLEHTEMLIQSIDALSSAKIEVLDCEAALSGKIRDVTIEGVEGNNAQVRQANIERLSEDFQNSLLGARRRLIGAQSSYDQHYHMMQSLKVVLDSYFK